MTTPLDAARLHGWREPPLRHRWAASDSILYALGLGVGSDPMDPCQLRLVDEQGLLALPTLATVLAARFGWLYRTGAGIDATQCVQGEQGLRVHHPLPPAGEVVGDLEVTHLVDKGPGNAAIVHFERRLRDASDGTLFATLTASMFCRGQGGFGGVREGPPPKPSVPVRAPDAVWEWPTLPQQALLYRQCGDRNPIHSDPAVAAAAGFPRPILHGLCTYGIASCILLKEKLHWTPAALRSLHARFVSPLYPGETLVMECWDEHAGLRFRCSSKERRRIVLDHGLANESTTY